MMTDDMTRTLRMARRHAYLMTGSRDTGDGALEAALRGFPGGTLTVSSCLAALYGRLPRVLVTATADPVLRRLLALPFFNRAVVVLVVVQALTVGDAAAILGVSGPAAADLLDSARDLLATGADPRGADSADRLTRGTRGP